MFNFSWLQFNELAFHCSFKEFLSHLLFTCYTFKTSWSHGQILLAFVVCLLQTPFNEHRFPQFPQTKGATLHRFFKYLNFLQLVVSRGWFTSLSSARTDVIHALAPRMISLISYGLTGFFEKEKSACKLTRVQKTSFELNWRYLHVQDVFETEASAKAFVIGVKPKIARELLYLSHGTWPMT